MSLKNLALDVESIALALSEEGGYEYYHIDDDLKELAKNVSDLQAENAKLRDLARDMHAAICELCARQDCDTCKLRDEGACERGVLTARACVLGIEVDA